MATYIDTDGNSFDVANGEYLFDQRIHDGLYVVYQKTDRDVGLLLEAMNTQGIAVADDMSKEALLLRTCTKRNGSCSGSCTSGSCKSYSTGNFSGCKCY